jgi:RPA family protein
MKLRYFIPAIIALFSLALTSCSEDDSKTLFDEVQVTSSSVGIPIDGGSTSVGVNATQAWSIDPEEVPEWLTVSPMNGQSGQTAVSFTAPAASEAEKGRQAVLHITCAGKRQSITVFQGFATVTDATCAEVIAGPESKTYRVTGIVKSIANTTYGNWYLADETGEIYIYGTLDAKGNEKNFLSLGIEVGDIVTVEGPKTLYGSTVELVNVTVIKIQKSLVKVEGYDPENATFPLEGGEVDVNLSCKTNNGISVEIPEEAQDWLSMVSITGGAEPVVTFRAQPNAGGDRDASVVFMTTDDDGRVYTATATLHQKGAIIEAPIADFLAAEVGDTQYRLTGVITELYSSDSQGKSFYIRDYSGTTLVYRAEGFIESGAKVGDVITVVGKRGAYRENPQMVSGNVEAIKVVTPVTLDEFLAKEDAADVYYMITGVIDEIANPTYGNLYLKEGDTRVYVYGCYPGWGATGDNRKNFLETAGIVVGDRLSVIGVRGTHNGTPQLANGIYFSHVPAN